LTPVEDDNPPEVHDGPSLEMCLPRSLATDARAARLDPRTSREEGRIGSGSRIEIG
jgi:hypothetical protein